MATIKIALAGNPNSGKTTLFNDLTGSNQYVGNWPGVTVEKKEGGLLGHEDVIIQDLPGIYSLSPYTLEEVVTRNYLVNEKPDAILNIVDGTNIERNLYLTTQLIELGIPVVVAINMMDLVRRNGDSIDTAALAKELRCTVVETSALKGEGSVAAAEKVVEIVKAGKAARLPAVFVGSVEHAIAHIEESLEGKVPPALLRWYSVKVFERDPKALEELNLEPTLLKHLEEHIRDCEEEMDDDAESVIINERYDYIGRVVKKCVRKKQNKDKMTTSDKIDRVVTHRVLGLPIFAAIMFLIYALAMGNWDFSVGARLTDWANDGVFGDGWLVPFVSDAAGYEEAAGAWEEAQAVLAAYEAGESEAYLYDDESGEDVALPVNAETYAAALAVTEPEPGDYGLWVPSIPALLDGLLTGPEGAPRVPDWLYGLVMEGIVPGIGAVLGFVPQMLVLFLMLSILEDVGYMSRVAFVMDRVFRQFGLSGKSFIPLLVATGCGVPGLMASRTIENDADRKLTLMTTTFMPCGAKLPIIALIAGAFFGGSAWIAGSAYLLGIASVVLSGLILKKFKAFSGNPSPFVMELPAYHMPLVRNVLKTTWERGWSFVKRAGAAIFVSSIIIWFLSNFGFVDGGFGLVPDMDGSLLAALGGLLSWLFVPLGFGTWQATVATITGLLAKEQVVGTMGVLYGAPLVHNVRAVYSGIAGYSFMAFNLLCIPCFAAVGTIHKEMNSPAWTAGAIGYMIVWSYAVSLVLYHVVGLAFGVGFSLWTVVALAVLAAMVYLVLRPQPKRVSA